MAEDTSATFVFKGTVKRVRATTVADLPADARTFVVTVDHVIEASPALAALSGHEVTVRVARGVAPTVGQEFVFHTLGWIFGDGVAVHSVRQEPVQRRHAAILSRGGDAVDHKRQREVRQRFDTAGLVVSGRVVAVRLPAEARAPAALRLRAAAAETIATTVTPVSEHDPKWREAVIEVDEVHKGRHTARELVIRFPASTDVRWYRAPKFHAGHQGFFVLHQTDTGVAPARASARRRTGRARATAAAAAPEATPQVYTALSPLDFQGYQELGGVRALISARQIEPGPAIKEENPRHGTNETTEARRAPQASRRARLRARR